MPEDAITDALFKLKNFENAELVQKNELFMDYLQYNNAARAIARDVAFTKNTDKTELEKEYFKPITKLYAAKIEELTPTDSEVTIEISLKISQTLGLTKFIGFPPNELTPIKYVMPIETSAE